MSGSGAVPVGFEVELKFPVDDLDELRRRLAERGASGGVPVEQADLYLRHPGRDFAATNEAFRLRRVGDANALTYKGPKLDGPTKTREEIEVRFASGPEPAAAMSRLLDRLGFAAVAEVVKRREAHQLTFAGRRMEVVLDEVRDLGTFAEVETLARGAEDLPEAQAAVTGLAAALGLGEAEPRSYLRMLLERRAGSPGPS
jgi:adenylate cyclase class 2